MALAVNGRNQAKSRGRRTRAAAVGPEPRQREAGGGDGCQAHQPTGPDRGRHAHRIGHEASARVADQRASQVADRLDAGQAAAQRVGNRLVPDRFVSSWNSARMHSCAFAIVTRFEARGLCAMPGGGTTVIS